MSNGIDIGKIDAQLSADPTSMVRGVAQARSAIEAIRAELKRLGEEEKRGAITTADATARFGELQAAVVRLETGMQGAFTRLTATGSALDTVTTKANQTRSAFGGLGMAMMQMAYIADDVRYGFAAIVNNIAPLATSLSGAMGASAGKAQAIGAAAQVAAVAVYELYNHWDNLREIMGVPVLKTAAEEMEDLARKTHKTFEETKKLADYRKHMKAIDKRSESEDDLDKTEKLVDKAMAKVGGPGMRHGIEASLLEEGKGKLTPEEEDEAREKARMHVLGVPVGPIDHDKALAELATARAAKLKKEVDRLIGARTIPERKELRELVKKHPDLFPEGTLKGLEDAEPEAVRKAAKAKADAKARKKVEASHKAGAKAAKSTLSKLLTRGVKAATQSIHKSNTHRRNMVKQAKEMLPNIERDAHDTLLRNRRKGINKSEAVSGRIAQMLKNKGMDEKDADKAALDITAEADKGAKATMGKNIKTDLMTGEKYIEMDHKKLEGLMGNPFGGRDSGRMSEIYSSADITNRVQSGVGGAKQEVEILKKMQEQNEKLREVMEEIRDAEGNGVVKIMVT